MPQYWTALLCHLSCRLKSSEQLEVNKLDIFCFISVDGSFDTTVFINIFWCWGSLEPQKKLSLQWPSSTILRLQKFDVSHKWSEVTSSMSVLTLASKRCWLNLLHREPAIQNMSQINMLEDPKTYSQAALRDLRPASDLRVPDSLTV